MHDSTILMQDSNHFNEKSRINVLSKNVNKLYPKYSSQILCSALWLVSVFVLTEAITQEREL